MNNDLEKDRDYSVYMHTFPNGKKYIGITNKEPTKRWKNGKGYKTQMIYNAIKKYGWNNIKHEILFSGLSKETACKKEKQLINKYQTNNIKNGYNLTIGGDVGKDNSYMCQEAQEFIRSYKMEMKKYCNDESFNEIIEYFNGWKYICEIKSEGKLFNIIYSLVCKWQKEMGFAFVDGYVKIMAINVYIESYLKGCTPESAIYNTKYFLNNYAFLFDNPDVEWKNEDLLNNIQMSLF